MQKGRTPRFVSYREATAISGLSRTTLWRLIGTSSIRAAKVGSAVRIDEESLLAFMKRSSERANEQ